MMVDVRHRVGATVAPEKVYEALTTRDGLAAWWTTDTTGDGVVGGTTEFRFGDAGGFDMKVLDQRPNERVEWEVTDGPEEWIGTHVSFDLTEEGDYTIVHFAHEGWREPGEFMSHCSTKWATFLMSMKRASACPRRRSGNGPAAARAVDAIPGVRTGTRRAPT